MAVKDWGYIKTSSDEVIINSYRGKNKVVVVPKEIGGRKVVEISYYAFSPKGEYLSRQRRLIRSRIQEVVIPEGVRRIGPNAFYNCKLLRKITFPDSLEYIGEHCFRNCINLENVVINNTKARMGYRAFEGCEKLDKLKYPFFIIENGVLKEFTDCKKETEIIIPKGVTEIAVGAFEDCDKIKSVIIPKGVTRIGASAFWGCKSLESVKLPDSIVEIENHAFANCSLKTVRLPKGLTEIKEYTFFFSSLNSIVIPEGVTKIGSRAFSSCRRLKSVVLPNSLKEIDDNAFSNTNVINIKLPLGLVRIGKTAFAYSNIKRIDIPDGVKAIKSGTFEHCAGLRKVKIPNSVREIGSEAFFSCNSLKKLIIPKTVRTIDRSAFMCCYNLSVVSDELIEDWESIEHWGWSGGKENIIQGFIEGCRTGHDFSEEVRRKNTEYIEKHKQIFLITEEENHFPALMRMRKSQHNIGEFSNFNYSIISNLSGNKIKYAIEEARKRDFILIYGENCETIKELITDYDGVIITSSQLPDEDKFIALAETLSFALDNNELSTVNAQVMKEFFHNVESIDFELKDMLYDRNNLEPVWTTKDRVLFSMSYPEWHAQKVREEQYERFLKGFKYNMAHERRDSNFIEARIILVREKKES